MENKHSTENSLLKDICLLLPIQFYPKMCYMENTSGKKLPLKMGSNEGDYWKNIFRILH